MSMSKARREEANGFRRLVRQRAGNHARTVDTAALHWLTLT